MNLAGKIESLLFVASKPMSMRKIADLLGVNYDTVREEIGTLQQLYNTEERGIQIAQHGMSVQMVTSQLNAKIVADFLKDERSGELTRPSLETLTIIAYRGPLPKSEIDMIRGVNCSLILRNLMIRGLIDSCEDKERMTTMYEISFDFLRHLGIRAVTELPNYHALKSDERLEILLHPEKKATPSEPLPDTATAKDSERVEQQVTTPSP
ncbi:MAG: SMC-Scp complex subunit ScpB [Candidatus Kerfeldbacteria bacterium]